MIEVTKEECIIVNFREHENGDLFIVFMVKEQGFLKGILKAEQRLFIGEIKHFHYAEVSYFDLRNGNETLAISNLKLLGKAEESPPVF